MRIQMCTRESGGNSKCVYKCDVRGESGGNGNACTARDACTMRVLGDCTAVSTQCTDEVPHRRLQEQSQLLCTDGVPLRRLQVQSQLCSWDTHEVCTTLSARCHRRPHAISKKRKRIFQRANGLSRDTRIGRRNGVTHNANYLQ